LCINAGCKRLVYPQVWAVVIILFSYHYKAEQLACAKLFAICLLHSNFGLNQ
jgi:hypothetical protein